MNNIQCGFTNGCIRAWGFTATLLLSCLQPAEPLYCANVCTWQVVLLMQHMLHHCTYSAGVHCKLCSRQPVLLASMHALPVWWSALHCHSTQQQQCS
jgi:hypothetical protein